MWENQPGNLIESNTKNYLFHVLRTCHANRLRVYSLVFNALVLFFLLLIGGCTLYFCHKRKNTPYELQLKYQKEQAYIMSKIRQYQENRFQQHESLTHLPTNAFEVVAPMIPIKGSNS